VSQKNGIQIICFEFVLGAIISEMNSSVLLDSFVPVGPDAAGVVSWVHLGDLHMTRAGEQNHLDLAAIVDEVNGAFAGAVSFVFLPGDVADDGSRAAYAVVRGELDRLTTPWCAIVGDHDVHEKRFANFLSAMAERTHYAFVVGNLRFVAMNAFDIADPGSFTVSEDQLTWVKRELQTAADLGQVRVLLLHCYPSDLKVGGGELMEIVHNYGVKLIDMGHTHYNEVANDGRVLYTATRSTGQIEEGPVGFSVTNLDDGSVSWRFVELGKLPVVMITSPQDERLMTAKDEAKPVRRVRAKVWSDAEIVRVTGTFEGREFEMAPVEGSRVWEGSVAGDVVDDGVRSLRVEAEDAEGRIAKDEIRVAVGGRTAVKERAARDQENALEAWPEHGLLGTQLGPNKNGKKW